MCYLYAKSGWEAAPSLSVTVTVTVTASPKCRGSAEGSAVLVDVAALRDPID